MINREVIYERTVTGSYMKIPAGINADLDERLMLKKKLQGTLPVEKTYVDGCGQYWYNISGKQSLDTYCRVKEIGIDFVEKLAVSICSELDILEWNLVQANCLVLDPELIFITNANQEFIFTLYPGNSAQVETEFQQLMEYLLTKINHKDEAAVRTAYGIYEKTLEEGYSIMDIRETIMREKQMQIAEAADRKLEVEAKENGWQSGAGARENSRQAGRAARENSRRAGRAARGNERQPDAGARGNERQFDAGARGSDRQSDAGAGEAKSGVFWGKRSQIKGTDRHKKEGALKRLWIFMRKQLGYETDADVRTKDANLVYPDEEIYVPKEEIHPTVYLGSAKSVPQGILLYQGAERLEDICLEGRTARIGYGADADIRIDHETISQMHARIDCDGDNYFIEDLNSTNGTYVNGELLAYKERRQLKASDVIRFANLAYRFC